MSLKWIEGFESYSNLVAQLANRYVTVAGPTLTFQPGRAIGNALQMNGNLLLTPTFDDQATWIVGFAFKNVNLPLSTTNMTVLEVRDGTVAQVALHFNPSTKVFSVYSSTNLLGTGASVVTTGSWYYIEMLVTIHGSAGVVHLKVNGIDQVNVTGANTKVTSNASANTFAWRGPTAASLTGSYQMDDVYICDDQGSVNNDFLGDMKVEAVSVIDSGNDADWTCNVTNVPNFEAVQVLDDGVYVSSNTVDDQDSYLCSKLNKITSNIAGVSAVYWSRNTDSTQHAISPSVRISVTDYFADDDLVITDTAIKAYSSIWEQDPSTSAAWSVDGVNSAQFGMKLSS